jgi:hypothetical protein
MMELSATPPLSTPPSQSLDPATKIATQVELHEVDTFHIKILPGVSGAQSSSPKDTSQADPAYFRYNAAVIGMTFKAVITIDVTKEFNAVDRNGGPLKPIRFELYRSPQTGSWTAVSKETGAMLLPNTSSLTGRGDSLREVKNALLGELERRLAH